MCEELLAKVMDKWGSTTTVVQVEVEGLTNYKMLTKFKEALIDEVRGIKGVYERKYKDGVAEFDVNLQGKVSHLATELESKDFTDFIFTVASKSANSIKIKAKSKK